MRNKLSYLLIVMFLFIAGCNEEVIPKPRAMLRLQYPDSEYRLMNTRHFQFNKNVISSFEQKDKNSLTLDYPTIKGSLFLTYKKVDNNIERLLIDAQRLSFEHAVKADRPPQAYPFVNAEDKVYGVFFEVIGDAASQAQFYVTDSTNHFVTGSLYFYTKPNYDSIYPAADYLQNDIREIMESIRWKE